MALAPDFCCRSIGGLAQQRSTTRKVGCGSGGSSGQAAASPAQSSTCLRPWKPATNWIKLLLFVSDDADICNRAFIPAKPFQPSLVSKGKDRSQP